MSEVTRLLDAAATGDPRAAADLLPLVYNELRALAARYLAHEAPGQTLQPTALVHEAYVRLVGSEQERNWVGQGHFFAAAAQAMRRILIDTARFKKREKRGGGRAREDLDPDRVAVPEAVDELLALNDALTALAAAKPVVAELVTLRYFGGLTLKQAAEVMGIAPRTADAYWAYARAWLADEMTRGEATDP